MSATSILRFISLFSCAGVAYPTILPREVCRHLRISQLHAIVANGGRILMARAPVPTVGVLTKFEDTEGNVLGAMAYEHEPQTQPAAQRSSPLAESVELLPSAGTWSAIDASTVWNRRIGKRDPDTRPRCGIRADTVRAIVREPGQPATPEHEDHDGRGEQQPDSFTPAGSTNSLGSLPPFCRVVGVIAPTPDSQIVFEAWLPLDNWNGKFAGVGNGGWAGTVSFGALADQLRRGYATASTNTGHEASPGTNAARFAFDKPEQLIDFAYRAHHETAVQAKALVQTFYGKPADRSYFVGCSSGGYEGLCQRNASPPTTTASSPECWPTTGDD